MPGQNTSTDDASVDTTDASVDTTDASVDTTPLQRASLQTWVAALLGHWGYTAENAEYLANSLVDANVRGVDSHGVVRLPAYERRITERLVDPSASPIVTVDGSVVVVDANGAAGQIATRAAAEAVLHLSRQTGVATAVVRGSTHFGAAGFYARWLAERGAIALITSNSEPVVVPHGGRDALLGTNPLAFAAPTRGAPISLDMATSTSAMGKVLIAQTTGDPIPKTWGVDETGAPTTDANAIKALLPVGGPKGYGLGFLVEILAGILSGSAFSHGLGNMYSDFSKPQDVGHWLLAVDIEHFLTLDEFTDRISALVDMAHSVPPAEGVSDVLVPGEPEDRTAADRGRNGIPLPSATIDDLTALGDRHGVPFPKGSNS